MTRLFVELYLDEDVSVLVADLVRARGFAALTARDAGQLHASDAGQLGFINVVFPHQEFVMLSRSKASLILETEILRSGCGLHSG